LFQGKNGFASYTPVLVPAEGDVETLAGVVNGIFAMDALVDDALKQTTWAQG
jgi:sensor domain CHASE-containing protein